MFKRQDSVGNRYFIFSVFVTIWGTGTAIEISQASSYQTALLGARIANMGALFIPPTWFHFTAVFSDRSKQYTKMIIFLYCLAAAMCFIGFTPLFISTVKPALTFNYFSRLGRLYHIFTLMFFTVVPYSFLLLFRKMKRSEKTEALQIKGFIIATGIGFIGGALTFFPAYEIMIPQYGLFIMPIYPFVIAYFMTRHKLFDIEQMIQSFQREKLATIGLIASSINHEIRNPLYAVKSLLETYIDDDESGRQRKMPSEISKKALAQVTRALDVITKLNKFSKPATDPNTQDSKASIQEAIQNVLDLVSCEFELDKIKINNQIPIDLPPIQADQRQLEEILFNLIVNACHAMKGQGVRDKEQGGGILEIRSTQHAERITVEIEDTGTGIPPEQAKHLFEPFHTTKGENGTGLGLYITKQLVERNGGRIFVNSKSSQGTSVILEFRSHESI